MFDNMDFDLAIKKRRFQTWYHWWWGRHAVMTPPSLRHKCARHLGRSAKLRRAADSLAGEDADQHGEREGPYWQASSWKSHLEPAGKSDCCHSGHGDGPSGRSWERKEYHSYDKLQAHLRTSGIEANMGIHILKLELLYNQWEIQDPKIEVLYHIRPYFVGIFPYIGLI